MLEHFEVFGHAGFFVRWMPGPKIRLAIRKVQRTGSQGTINKLKTAGIAVVVLIVVIVVLQNTQAVETKLLFLSVTMPNAALLFGTLIIGFAIGVLTAGPASRRPMPFRTVAEWRSRCWR